MKIINLNEKDLDIISMALIDNAITGHLNRIEYKMTWDILECLYDHTSLSRSNLKLICDSLLRYAIRYDYELIEPQECRRVYDMIQEACSNE